MNHAQDVERRANGTPTSGTRAAGNAERAAALQALAEVIRDLEQSPLYEFRTQNGYQPVVGEGGPDAAIMMVGEAPGEQEAKSGRPFVGNAGRVLDKLLKMAELNRKDIYITNVVKDRPPGNRDPRPDEIRLYAPFLMQQIEIIQPAVIVTLGRIAKETVMERFGLVEYTQKVSELHGKVFEAEAAFGPVKIVPMYHPAAAFYNQDLQQVIAVDFQVLKQFI